MLKTVLLAAVLPCAAGAQTPCMDRAGATEMMYNRYGESLVGEGQMNNGPHIVIFANPMTGTFTVTYAEGSNLCLLGEGVDWAITAPLPVGDPA